MSYNKIVGMLTSFVNRMASARLPALAEVRMDKRLVEDILNTLRRQHQLIEGLVSIFDSVTMKSERELRDDWLPQARGWLRGADGVSLHSSSHPPDTRIAKEMALESALIELANATDGLGRKIILYRSPPGTTHTVESLRTALAEFAGRAQQVHVLVTPEGIDRTRAEAAYCRNLAALARALAAALA